MISGSRRPKIIHSSVRKVKGMKRGNRRPKINTSKNRRGELVHGCRNSKKIKK